MSTYTSILAGSYSCFLNAFAKLRSSSLSLNLKKFEGGYSTYSLIHLCVHVFHKE